MDRLAPERAVLVDLLVRTAENRGRRGADVQHFTRRNRDGPYDVRERGDDAAQLLAKRLEFSFRLAAGGAVPPPSPGPPHGGRQRPGIPPHHGGGGAALRRARGKFLSARAPDADKR